MTTTKQIATVRVNLGNNEFMTCRGTLSKDGKVLKMNKGLICTIKECDVVTVETVEVKKRKTHVACPFDMVNWFAKSKQL